jgi:hypothetical protein
LLQLSKLLPKTPDIQKAIETDYEGEGMDLSFTDTLDPSIKAEIDDIKTLAELSEYYEKNKGKGKAFDKYIMAKKQQLTEKPHENS